MTPRNLVIAGAIVAIVGCLCPFMHVPIAGSISYVANGHGDGVVVIALSIVALVLAAARLPVVGIIAGALVGFQLFRVQGVMEQAAAQLHSTAAGAGLFSGLAKAIADAVYLEFGFYVVATGAAMMLLGGVYALLFRRGTSIAAPPEAAGAAGTISTDAAAQGR